MFVFLRVSSVFSVSPWWTVFYACCSITAGSCFAATVADSQPTSALSQWYQQRFGGGGAVTRRIGIVALARRLLIALWRYVETGIPPAGALLKA